MSAQKPVAWMFHGNQLKNMWYFEQAYGWESKPQLLYDADVTALFTAEQLKAEREKAIMECAEICNAITNKAAEIAKRCNHSNSNDWFYEAEQWMESSALNASSDCHESILELLSTDESKDEAK